MINYYWGYFLKTVFFKNTKKEDSMKKITAFVFLFCFLLLSFCSCKTLEVDAPLSDGTLLACVGTPGDTYGLGDLAISAPYLDERRAEGTYEINDHVSVGFNSKTLPTEIQIRSKNITYGVNDAYIYSVIHTASLSYDMNDRLKTISLSNQTTNTLKIEADKNASVPLYTVHLKRDQNGLITEISSDEKIENVDMKLLFSYDTDKKTVTIERNDVYRFTSGIYLENPYFSQTEVYSYRNGRITEAHTYIGEDLRRSATYQNGILREYTRYVGLDNKKFTHEFDKNGNYTKYVHYINDQTLQTVYYTYNEADQLVKRIFSETDTKTKTEKETQRETYEYYENGTRSRHERYDLENEKILAFDEWYEDATPKMLGERYRSDEKNASFAVREFSPEGTLLKTTYYIDYDKGILAK